jgi:hypothetical protein
MREVVGERREEEEMEEEEEEEEEKEQTEKEETEATPILFSRWCWWGTRVWERLPCFKACWEEEEERRAPERSTPHRCVCQAICSMGL